MNLLKDCTQILRVNISFARDSFEADKTFTEEIKFYTGIKGKRKARNDEYRQVLSSCDPKQMFDNIQLLIEDNEKQAAEMPVRKFYNNTFGTLLNRAMFSLHKKQM